MKLLKILFALISLALVFVFCIGNDTKVVVNFLDYSSPEIYLFLLLLTTFVLGMISASFASTIKVMQLKRQIRQLQVGEGADPAGTKKEKKKRKKTSDVKEADESAVVEPTVKDTVKPSPPSAAPAPSSPSEEVTEAIFEEPEQQTAAEDVPDVIELPAEQSASSDDVSQEKPAS